MYAIPVLWFNMTMQMMAFNMALLGLSLRASVHVNLRLVADNPRLETTPPRAQLSVVRSIS